MVCWGNEQKVFELWSCWWGCPPLDHRKVTCPQPGRVSVCAPAPSPVLCCRGRTGVLRAGSDAMSSVCRAPVPGGSQHMWEAAGLWAASRAPQRGWSTDTGRQDRIHPCADFGSTLSCAEPQASSQRRGQPAKTSLRHCVHQRHELPASHSCL